MKRLALRSSKSANEINTVLSAIGFISSRGLLNLNGIPVGRVLRKTVKDRIPIRATAIPVFSMHADGSVYTITAGSDRPDLIPFAVSADSGVNKIYLLVNGRLVGFRKPSEKFFWRAKPGVFRLTVSDDAGRSYSVNFSVELSAGAGSGT